MGNFRLHVVLVFWGAFIAVASGAEICSWFNQHKNKCPKTNVCLRTSELCDGRSSCPDGSDEVYCSTTFMPHCSSDEFQCSDGKCYSRDIFCDDKTHCSDGSDEFFCGIDSRTICPQDFFRCKDGTRCIPEDWMCDISVDCLDISDETNCVHLTSTFPPPTVASRTVPETFNARRRNVLWLLSRRKNDSSTDRWGHDLPRIATSLYLANKDYFSQGNKIGEEIGYELTIQLLHKLSGNNTMRSQELAMYIQALVVTCSDPRNFFGHNLVSELRRRVEASNYTNPFEILTLCNAGDSMTDEDIKRVTSAFDSPHRPFWTDTQAIATMAMQCLSSSPNVKVDERMVKDMQDELKKRQFRNGTVDNPITTALVIQALLRNDSYKEFFDMSAAISVLLESQDESGSWGSVRNSYYVLPALHYTSLLNISSNHCVKLQESEEEVLEKLQSARGNKFVVQYSVWFGNDVDLGRTWRVKMKTSRNNTFYDVIETVRKLDNRHNVKYNVIDRKPYVSSLYGKDDDPEMGVYWFTYVRSLLLPSVPNLIEASPIDVKIGQNKEYILWYKPGKWSDGGSTHEEVQ